MQKIKGFAVFFSLLVSLETAATGIQKDALPFGTGEQLVYDMGWKAASAGTTVLKVAEKVKRGNRSAYHLTCVAQSNEIIDTFFPVRDRYDSWLDATTLTSLGLSKHIKEGNHSKDQTVLIDPKKNVYPVGIQDILSAGYFIRAQNLKVGEKIIFPLLDGPGVRKIAIAIIGEATVENDLGKFPCFVLEPLYETDSGWAPNPKVKIRAWMSNDKRRLPVRVTAGFEWGEITADLAQYIPSK